MNASEPRFVIPCRNRMSERAAVYLILGVIEVALMFWWWW